MPFLWGVQSDVVVLCVNPISSHYRTVIGGVAMIVRPGIYIGKDIEIAVTEKYTLIFVAQKGTLISFLAQSTNLECIHVVRTSQEGGSVKFEYLLTRQGGMNYVRGTDLLKYQGQPAAEMSWKDGSIECAITFLDGIFHADVHEFLTLESLTPKMLPATEGTLAQCLNQWHLGMYEVVKTCWNQDFFKGIILNTPKHMYLYEAMEGDRIYIRAARYRCTDKGVAFNQNFRQFYVVGRQDSAHHVIAKDNRIAMQELAVNEEYFHPHFCCLDENTFYWSIDSYDSGMIRLNGCGGESYHWMPGRPAG